MHRKEKTENGASVRPSFRPYILSSCNHYFISLILTFFHPSVLHSRLSVGSTFLQRHSNVSYHHRNVENISSEQILSFILPACPTVQILWCMDSTNFLSNGWKRTQNWENHVCVYVCVLQRMGTGGQHYHWTFIYLKKKRIFYEEVNRWTVSLASS
jgi:hypothetical protein